ncbi:MAG TPA: sigma-70 family RNA polymerase sigma factor [Blastocatellia bacterium]|jgi:RNA polymerase sigma factor (TIGR02999 family)|nr:sigma-70 family RNA polymerase sigma factor [Blastocatellia bacterium]
MAAKNITQLLQKWSEGDRTVADELFPIVYNELWGLARGYMRHERNNVTLQPTALVHEAYLRLIEQENQAWPSRSHFFAFAATIMRHVLVDHARKRLANKRGGELRRISLTHADPISNQKPLDVIILDEALNQLATIKQSYSQIFECRFFGGLTIDETADYLKMSHATVERGYTFARAWLNRYLSN